LLQPKEKDPFKDNPRPTTQCQKGSKEGYIFGKKGSESDKSREKKDRHKKGQGDPPTFARIDLF
jgi:hypothetical protein